MMATGAERDTSSIAVGVQLPVFIVATISLTSEKPAHNTFQLSRVRELNVAVYANVYLGDSGTPRPRAYPLREAERDSCTKSTCSRNIMLGVCVLLLRDVCPSQPL